MAAEREKKTLGFKRINFFRGFLTTEHDWNDAERYHLEKRQLHNRLCHAPGVIAGYQGELRIMARTRGDLSMEILPGYAMDGLGRDLVLWDAQIKTIVPEEYKLPQTLYIVLRYYEELADFIAYKENLEYKGHRRVLEGCKVEISQTPPDVRQEIELGRILLEKGATRIRDARDPFDPKANEIDLRFVPRAGIAGSFFEPEVRWRLGQTFRALRRGLFHMARDGQVMTAHDALSAVLSASTLHAAEQLDLRNIFPVFSLLIEMQMEISTDVETNHPSIAQRKEFADFRKHVDILRGLLSERRYTLDALQNLNAFQQKTGDIILSMFGGGPAVRVDEAPKPAAAAPAPTSASVTWDNVKTISSLELPSEVMIDGRSWVLVDRIDILDKESEESHQLTIRDAKDTYRSRQKLKYPDGNIVEDVGRAHVGGYCQYTIKNLTPGRELAIIRRMDYVYGDYELEFVVEGKNAGVCSCSGTDRVNRGRNWPFIIGPEFVTKDKLQIKQVAVTAGRDINMFRYWFYQPRG